MMYQDVKFATCTANDVQIDKFELASRVGAGISYSSEQLDIALERVKNSLDFRYAHTKVPVTVNENICDFSFAKCESKDLAHMLKDCENAYFLCVTAGLTIDRLILKAEQLSKSDAFFLDACASAYIEAFCNKIAKDLSSASRFSPGYGDLPLSFQIPLLDRLDSQRTVGVVLRDSLLMTPMKSITAIIGDNK